MKGDLLDVRYFYVRDTMDLIFKNRGKSTSKSLSSPSNICSIYSCIRTLSSLFKELDRLLRLTSFHSYSSNDFRGLIGTSSFSENGSMMVHVKNLLALGFIQLVPNLKTVEYADLKSLLD